MASSESVVLAALTEDAIAMAGAGIALAGVYLSRVTQNPIYDAVSALLIGLLLMGFALALAWENKRLLLGESLPAEDERELRRIVAEWDGVSEIVGFRTVFFGDDDIPVTADVRFAPPARHGGDRRLHHRHGGPWSRRGRASARSTSTPRRRNGRPDGYQARPGPVSRPWRPRSPSRRRRPPGRPSRAGSRARPRRPR